MFQLNRHKNKIRKNILLNELKFIRLIIGNKTNSFAPCEIVKLNLYEYELIAIATRLNYTVKYNSIVNAYLIDEI